MASELGDDLGVDLEAYEAAARSGGPMAVASALMSRHNTRWSNALDSAPFAAAFTIPRLGPLPHIDRALDRFGLSYSTRLDRASPIGMPSGSWLGSIRWGADSAATALRLMLLGQGVGAAVLLRGQVERWSSNRAHALGLTRAEDEPWADFITRVWSGAWPLSDPGKGYRAISSLLHGRGQFAPLFEWESFQLARGVPPDTAAVALMVFADAISLVIHQVRVLAIDYGSRVSRLVDVEGLADLALMTKEAGALSNPVGSLAPLSLVGLGIPQVRLMRPLAMAYETWLREPSLGRSHSAASLADLAFVHRRYRSIRAATRALQLEASRLGEEFHPENLEAREYWYTWVSELAALSGGWAGDPHRRAAANVASTAVRSAFLTWLEDDPRTAGMARSILEATARMRSWRLKPEAAQRLEDRGEQTTARDWFETAGWRRLLIVNRALGELSHVVPTSRWAGAQETLADLEGSSYWGDPPVASTQRGDILNRAVLLLGTEVLESIRAMSPGFAQAVTSLIQPSSHSEGSLEVWLNRAHGMRGSDLGPPMFRPVTAKDYPR